MTRSPRRETHAAVVGAGFGGLAAAIRLQAAGVRTTIFEARDQPGGRAYVYRDRGFTFDGGPTVITAPHCLEELFEIADRKIGEYVELLPVQPFYRLLWQDGSTFDYDGDVASMCEQIRRRNPQDAQGYLEFAEYSRKVFEAGYENLAATPFLRIWDMLREAPALIRLRADRTVYRAVSRFIADEHVRQAMSFHSLLVGGNPFETSAIYTLIPHLERKWGVFFPRGGMGALVAALARLFVEIGGELRLCAPVQRIDVESREDGRVVHRVTSDARASEDFDLVVANSDVHHTYAKLYAGHPKAARRARRLAKLDWSMSLFVLYFGTDRTYAGDVLQHTILFGPRYRELLAEIFHGHRLPDDQSLYLHSPTQTDPSLAPPGCGSFYVLSPVPHLGNAPLDWDRIGEAYADRLLGALERWLPDLRRHVVTRHWITPRTFETELRSYQGSAFSCAPTLLQSAYFRPHNRDPDIPGLYIVGAGTHPGAGIPGVVSSAKATARLIETDLGL
jgi:phytoene desaturase